MAPRVEPLRPRARPSRDNAFNKAKNHPRAFFTRFSTAWPPLLLTSWNLNSWSWICVELRLFTSVLRGSTRINLMTSVLRHTKCQRSKFTPFQWQFLLSNILHFDICEGCIMHRGWNKENQQEQNKSPEMYKIKESLIGVYSWYNISYKNILWKKGNSAQMNRRVYSVQFTHSVGFHNGQTKYVGTVYVFCTV